MCKGVAGAVARHCQNEAGRTPEDGVASESGPQEAATANGTYAQVPSPPRATSHRDCSRFAAIQTSCCFGLAFKKKTFQPADILRFFFLLVETNDVQVES
jgi:hypothetical protein